MQSLKLLSLFIYSIIVSVTKSSGNSSLSVMDIVQLLIINIYY